MDRVVITGMGVVAPNGHGLDAFADSLRQGRSGIRFVEQLARLNFGCQVAGVPEAIDELKSKYFDEESLLAMNSNMIYAAIAGIDCWRDAGFERPDSGTAGVDWDTGAIVGTGVGGLDTAGSWLVPNTDAGKVKRLGSTVVERIMGSGVSARLGGFLALGNQVTTNSSACTTGTEAVVDAWLRVRQGLAKRMLAGGSEGASHYIWAGFDGMRVLARKFNDAPERASRPMSATAAGFVPGAGAGLLMVESLTSARARGARIYAEILGGAVNCGGQRGGGSMTAPNPAGVRRCIREALAVAQLDPKRIDAINGHLTATMADPQELANWRNALEVAPDRLPWITSTKSLIGHGLGAAGGMECVASILQLARGFVHGSANCEDLHPELEPFRDRIVQRTLEVPIQILAKASFGFGDVNGCVIFQRWSE